MSLPIRVLFYVIIFTPVCLARDIYVSGKLGDDRNMGYSIEDRSSMNGPVRTLGRAIEIARKGDRIILDPKGGPYRESITLQGRDHSGSMTQPFIIEGFGAVLDGTKSIPLGVWKHYQGNIYRFQLTRQPINVTYFQLFNKGKILPRIDLKPDAKTIPKLESNTWCLHRGFVYFCCEKEQSVILSDYYDLSYSDQMSGVSLIQVQHVRLHDLTVRGFQLDGISAANGAREIVMDNVTCLENGRSGLAIGGASSVAAGYCVFEDNVFTQVLGLPYSQTVLFDCQLSEDGIEKRDETARVQIEMSVETQ